MSIISIDWALLMQELQVDSTLSKIYQAVKNGTYTPLGFTIHQDKLFYKERFVLAKASPFIPILLKEYHDSPMGGHGGEVKTYQHIAMEW